MPSIGIYASTNAKVRTIRSTLLNRRQYQQLAGSRDTHEFHGLLQQFNIGAGSGGQPVTERGIEHLILQDEITRLRAVMKGSKFPVRPLLLLYIERFDLLMIKRLMRRIHSGEESTVQPFHDTRYVYPEGAFNAEGLNQLAKALDSTGYGAILSDGLDAYRETSSLFRIEVALDRDLFTRTGELGKSLDRKNRQLLGRLLGLETDLINLSWVNRYHLFYKLTPAEIGDLLLPGGSRFSPELLRRAAAEQTPSALLEELLKKRGSGVRISVPEEQSMSGMALVEEFIYRALRDGARAAFMAFPFTLGATLGYIYLLKIQTRNLITLLNASYYELAPDAMESLLVL